MKMTTKFKLNNGCEDEFVPIDNVTIFKNKTNMTYPLIVARPNNDKFVVITTIEKYGNENIDIELEEIKPKCYHVAYFECGSWHISACLYESLYHFKKMNPYVDETKALLLPNLRRE